MSITFADVAELFHEHPHYVYANLPLTDFNFASIGTMPLEFRASGRVLRVRRPSPAPWGSFSGQGERNLEGLGLALLQGSPVADPDMRRVFPMRFDSVMRRWKVYDGAFLVSMKKYLT